MRSTTNRQLPTDRSPRTSRTIAAAGVRSTRYGATLIPLGIEVLFVLRGVLYGPVDHGPYNNSWGGPSRAGAPGPCTLPSPSR